MNGILTFLMLIFYLGLLVLYIYLIVLIVRACKAAIETRDIVKDAAYRDTARFFAEARRGLITPEDQDTAEADFISKHG